jgi:hypothetical protein
MRQLFALSQERFAPLTEANIQEALQMLQPVDDIAVVVVPHQEVGIAALPGDALNTSDSDSSLLPAGAVEHSVAIDSSVASVCAVVNDAESTAAVDLQAESESLPPSSGPALAPPPMPVVAPVQVATADVAQLQQQMHQLQENFERRFQEQQGTAAAFQQQLQERANLHQQQLQERANLHQQQLHEQREAAAALQQQLHEQREAAAALQQQRQERANLLQQQLQEQRGAAAALQQQLHEQREAAAALQQQRQERDTLHQQQLQEQRDAVAALQQQLQEREQHHIQEQQGATAAFELQLEENVSIVQLQLKVVKDQLALSIGVLKLHSILDNIAFEAFTRARGMSVQEIKRKYNWRTDKSFISQFLAQTDEVRKSWTRNAPKANFLTATALRQLMSILKITKDFRNPIAHPNNVNSKISELFGYLETISTCSTSSPLLVDTARGIASFLHTVCLEGAQLEVGIDFEGWSDAKFAEFRCLQRAAI